MRTLGAGARVCLIAGQKLGFVSKMVKSSKVTRKSKIAKKVRPNPKLAARTRRQPRTTKQVKLREAAAAKNMKPAEKQPLAPVMSFWGTEADGVGESTYCASDLPDSTPVTPRQSCASRFARPFQLGLGSWEPDYLGGTTCQSYGTNLCHTNLNSNPEVLALTTYSKTGKLQRKSTRTRVAASETASEEPELGAPKRLFSLYCEKEGLPWASDPLLSKFRKHKFCPEDCETDDEAVQRETRKCMLDLRDAVTKFVRFPPESLVENLHWSEVSARSTPFRSEFDFNSDCFVTARPVQLCGGNTPKRGGSSTDEGAATTFSEPQIKIQPREGV